MSMTQHLCPTLPEGDARLGPPRRDELATGEPLDCAAMPGLRLRVLSQAELAPATALLGAALPWDHVEVVAAEKLFGGNGRRSGQALGAFTSAGELVGVLAYAGRFIKLLAVQPEAQRRGIGTALFAAARARIQAGATDTPPPRLRIGDHPGNYLSPGVDERYQAAHAFFRARGLAEVARCLNLRAPLRDNPLSTPERAHRLHAAATAHGYTLRRARAEDVAGLLTMVAAEFSPVWADEVARALGPELGGAAAAYTPQLPEGAAVHLALLPSGAPVAFAAHDGNNRGLGWFGPMGTLPAHRGRGLGEALVLSCLADVGERPDGGVIAWVGPEAFYARTCGAIPDRRFVVYEEP